MAHLLGGVARAISRRATTSFYWPTLAWAFFLLVFIIQVWWVDFALSRQSQWTVAGFASVLLIPATLYFMAFLILPESSDMRATFFENRIWFFALLIAVQVFGSLQQLLAEGHFHTDMENWVKALGIAFCIAAICFRSEGAQKGFAIVGLVFAVWYLAYFFRLPVAT